MSDDREAPEARHHDTYKEDHWTVVDVEDVDKVFATESPQVEYKDDDGDEVRIDFDGLLAPSVMRDVGEEGDNVNVSAFLSVEKATELRDHLSEALDELNKSRGGSDE